ncbi:MAG: glycosyltransferase [Bacteroidales bacterium]|nr:glycosyltransferase [Bacteroidales bacterium]
MKKKIFVILSRIPYPLEKGDKLRAFHQLRELSKNNELIICAVSDIPVHKEAYNIIREFGSSVYFFRLRKAGIVLRLLRAFFSDKPYQVAYFYHKGIHRKIEQLIELHQPDHLFCQLIRTAAYARHSSVDKTIDYQDVFSTGLKRRLDVAPWYLKPLLRSEHKRVSRYEAYAFDLFDKKTIISRPDRDNIPHPLREEIHVIPNGVDSDYFTPLDREKRFDIIFSGNMAYPPNVNGAEYLVKKIMPLVWEERSDTRVVLAGATPSGKVKALASEKVTVTGWVDDIREYYAQSRIFVAPMQIGTGLQNKVLEAMAMQLPSVTSPLANKALRALDGEQLLIGRNASEYARHILSLLSDSSLSKNLGEKGYRFVLENFNWASTSAMLEKVITA